MDIIEIDLRWHDANTVGGWQNVHAIIDHDNPEYCLTRGFLLFEDDDCYKVAQTLGESGCLNVIIIPKGCVKWVKKKKYVKDKRDKKKKSSQSSLVPNH